MKQPSRKPSTLSESLQRHLNGYALAASAAGVGILVLTLVLLTPRPLEARSSKVSYQVLYSFQGQPDGAVPEAGLIGDSAGNLYGTTYSGGTGSCFDNYTSGCGTVFEIGSSGSETVLYNFIGGQTDGLYPAAPLLRDSLGNLYGTTTGGGASDAGTVFRVDTSGNETVLYSFTGGADGGYPEAGLIQDESGNLYGTTAGGASRNGVVFRLDASGHETVLHTFTGPPDGSQPYSSLMRDANGNLYGTTAYGGKGDCGGDGCGVVFKLDPSGNETILYRFSGADGSWPLGSVIQDAAGNLYGTTNTGGRKSSHCGRFYCGLVFKLDSAGKETVLFSFTEATTGWSPGGAVIRDTKGNLYGTTEHGGKGLGCNCGLVFEITPKGKETVLHRFTGGQMGGGVQSGLFWGASATLYGTGASGGDPDCGNGSGYGCGVVFALTP